MKLIVRQLSGLGNQMFQYAAGRYYARQIGAQVNLVFDPPHKALSHGHPRPFLLSHFSIDAEFRELNSFEERLLRTSDIVNHSRYLGAVRPMVGKIFQYTLARIFRLQLMMESPDCWYQFQRALPFDNHANAIYILGYWQVHQIAQSVSSDLRREFTFRKAPIGENLEMYCRIRSTKNSVSIHLRRGDYALDAEGNVTLPMTYYSSAINEIQAILVRPTFFVFSDDIDFARKSLSSEIDAVFVDHNDSQTAHEDLRLMSACRHHIIANSTFSWWGAWLSADPDGIVFAPRNWMVGQRLRYDDLFPAHWRLLG